MPVLPEFPRCSYLQTGEIFKSKIPVSRHMTQGSGHPLDGGDEPKSVMLEIFSLKASVWDLQNLCNSTQIICSNKSKRIKIF